MKVNLQIEVRIPLVPNFVHYGANVGDVLDIADLEPAQLEKIADWWKRDLLAKAQLRRQQQNKPTPREGGAL